MQSEQGWLRQILLNQSVYMRDCCGVLGSSMAVAELWKQKVRYTIDKCNSDDHSEELEQSISVRFRSYVLAGDESGLTHTALVWLLSCPSIASVISSRV